MGLDVWVYRTKPLVSHATWRGGCFGVRVERWSQPDSEDELEPEVSSEGPRPRWFHLEEARLTGKGSNSLWCVSFPVFFPSVLPTATLNVGDQEHWAGGCRGRGRIAISQRPVLQGLVASVFVLFDGSQE